MPSESPQPRRSHSGSSEEDVPPRPRGDHSSEIARLKRRLAASQEEVKELTEGKTKKPPYVALFSSFDLLQYSISFRTVVTMGRAIRRLVTLYESLDDLLQAADDHNSNDDDEDNDVELLTEEALEKKQECVTRYPLH